MFQRLLKYSRIPSERLVRIGAAEGTPPNIIESLNREINSGLSDPDMRFAARRTWTNPITRLGRRGRCRPECGWNSEWRIPGNMKLSFQAARSIG